mmetsp:Transcript_18675/g.25986  ORF Transcript_18675/g.25986 Transcript_18675/m.25986 type:complete len:518 (+) Transcript_18675:248-1801(+)
MHKAVETAFVSEKSDHRRWNAQPEKGEEEDKDGKDKKKILSFSAKTGLMTASSFFTRQNKSSIYSICPPFRFESIEEGVYRGAYPTMRNFTFLSSLGLRTIISLIPEEPSTDLATFANLVGARTVWIKTPKYKENVNMDKDTVRSVLEEMICPENLPLYVHCIDGLHVTGLIVMCLRKLEYWSLPSIYEEFSRFVPENTVPMDESKFLEAFDGGSRGGVLIPKRPPLWLWQGVRITRHPSIKLVSARQRRIIEAGKESNQCSSSSNNQSGGNRIKNSFLLKRGPEKTTDKKMEKKGGNGRVARNKETLITMNSQETMMLTNMTTMIHGNLSLDLLPRVNVYLVDPLASADGESVAYFDTVLCSPRNLKLLASGLYDDDDDDDTHLLGAFNIGNDDEENEDHGGGATNDAATLISIPKYPLNSDENVHIAAVRRGEDIIVDNHYHYNHHQHRFHLDPDPFSRQNFPNLLIHRNSSNSYMPSPYILQLLKKESKNFTAIIRALSLDGLTDEASPLAFTS